MKRILAILLLAIPIATFAQFRIVGEGLFTTVNDSTYRARVNFRTDLTGNSYNPTQLDTTMFVLSQRGQFYRLDSFYSQDFSSAFIVIVEKNGNWGSPSGQIMIFKNTGSIAAPQTVYAVNGATAAMQAQVDTWNSKLIKSLLDSVPSWNEAYASMIDSISFSGVDTIALTMYQRDGDSLTASFKIQPFLSAKFLDNQTDADTAEFQYNYDIGSFVYGANDLTQIPVLPGHWFVRNDTNITLTKGTIVMASGTIGASGRIKVLPLIANGTVDAKFVLGVVAKDIAGDADGYVMFYGKLRKINTSKYPESTVLYANPDTAGAFTAIEPSNGDLKLPVAFVIRSHPQTGVIAVRVNPGSYLRDLHDVDTSGVVNGSVLRYIDSLNYWRASTSPGVLFSDTLGTIATKSDVAVKLDSIDAADFVKYVDTLTTIATKTNVALKLNAADTASLSNRIDLKLDASDTVKYIKYIDTLTTIATKANVALKLNAVDTASLSNRIDLKLDASDTVKYIKYIDTLTTIATKANVALKLNAADTASLSNRIDLKLDASDTVKYIKYIDTLTTIATKTNVALKLNAADTASLSNRIDLKLNASDTVKYVKYTDTTATIATKTDLNLYQQKLTLVTNTRTEGAATLIGNTLNIPNYADTSIYREDGTLSSNRTVNLDSKTISFVKSASATTEYVRIGDKTVKVTNASLPSLIYETTVDPTGIQNSTGTFDSRVDMAFGTVTIRGNDAVDAGGTTSDIYVDANGKVKFRVDAGGTVDSVYGKNQFGELALTKIKEETQQQFSAYDVAANATALELSGPPNSGEAIIVVDNNNATPWDGMNVVGIILQYQSKVIFTGQGGILVSASASAYADTIKINIPDTSITGNKTRFTGIPGDASKLLGVLPDGRTDTVALGGTLAIAGGVLNAAGGGGGGSVTSVGLAVGTSGSDINVGGVNPVDSIGTIILNVPTASATVRGALSATDWDRFDKKLNISDTLSMLSTYYDRRDTVSVLNGGTGLTTFGGAGRVPYSTGATGTGLAVSSLFRTSLTDGNFIFGAPYMNNVNNVIIGRVEGSIFGNSSGTNNIAIGANTMYSLDNTSFGNINIGHYAGNFISSGDYNVNFGTNAGSGVTTGSKNINIGFTTGSTGVGTGSSNVLIGDAISPPVNNGSNQLSIGNLLFGTGMTGTGTTIPTAGKVGIKVASPTRDFHVAGEMRVTDLDTDATPSRIIGADTDGVFDTIGIGTGLSISGGTLNGTDTTSLSNRINAKIGGSGTTNYVSKFTASGTIGNSSIYDDGTKVGIGTIPNYSLSFSGNAARTISLERHTTSNTAGNQLTIQAGAATLGATDKNGGNLLLVTGQSTGTGSAQIEFMTSTAGASGTTDRTPTTKMTIFGSGNVGIGPNAVTSASKTLDVDGEVRIRDLNATTTPSRIVGADTDGMLDTMGIGTGLSIVNGTLNGTDTTSLSNRINLKLNISDTLNMLSTYIRNYGTQTIGGAKTFTSTVTATRFDPTSNSATGTGMFLPASGELGFSTGGVERMRIGAAPGRIGINFSDYSQVANTLDINGGLRVRTLGTGNAEKIIGATSDNDLRSLDIGVNSTIYSNKLGVSFTGYKVITGNATITENDDFIVVNTTGTVTLTLPTTYIGKVLTIKTIQNATVNSSVSNVLSFATNTSGTAILSGSAKFAKMAYVETSISPLTYEWVIMEAN